MSDTTYILLCYIKGDNTVFPVIASSTTSVGLLRVAIKEQKSNLLQGVDAASLTLSKVDVNYNEETEKQIEYGKYRPASDDQLDPMQIISNIWFKPPPHGHLHVFVRLSTPTELSLDIESVDKMINKELDSLRGMVESFLKNPEPPTWIPPDSATLSDREFLTNLRIPSYLNGNPSLLFHNLDACDDKEIETIFGPGAHQCICNTSGSGKTRRMLEGLTKYWGFYLVAIPDVAGVGVRDLQDALDDVRSQHLEWRSDLERVNAAEERADQAEVNSRIASTHLRKVLAARIVVFLLFLEVAIQADGTLQEKHKHIWLLFQLSDELVLGELHPFVRIIRRCLRRASDDALHILVERLDGIRRKYLPGSHFILGLDEAQQASRLYPRSFISSTDPNKFRSTIYNAVKVFAKSPIKKLIVSGTSLSLPDLEDAMAPGVSKPAEAVQLFHKLGMFDTWPKLKSFLERYIPVSTFESRSGHRLQQRMREYLQGRYRFSVTFVEYFLRNGLCSPHKLLNEYIKEHTGCLLGGTGDPLLRMSLLSKLQSECWALNSSAVTEAVRIVQSHLLKGQSPTYGPVTARLVEYGIARLREDRKGAIVEILAFLSLMRWLEGQGHLNITANLRLRLGNESERGSAFEEVGDLYLLRVLRDPVRFSTVFNFPSRCSPYWADEMAHIVARLDEDVAVDVLGGAPENPGLSVAHYASSIEDTIDWLDQPDKASALLVPSPLFGPDVMARCHSSSSNITILLMGQFNSCTVGNKESLDAETIAKALTSLHPDHWYKQAPSHQRQKLIDAIEKHHVLRFVSGYPLPVDLNLNAASVEQAIHALGANVALASLNVDIFRANFKSEDEAKNALSAMDDALNRKRKASEISNYYRGERNIIGCNYFIGLV